MQVLGADRPGLFGHIPGSGPVRCLPTQPDVNLARLAVDRPEIPLIARPDRTRPATVHALATAVDAEAAAAMALPADWRGRINLGLDRPSPTGGGPHPAPGAEPPSLSLPPSPVETSLHALITRVEQAAAAGRAITRTAALDRDCARLNRDTLHTAADLMRDLTLRAEPVRDAFHRPLPGDAYPLAWLTAAVYSRCAAVALTALRWLPAEGD